MEDLTKLMPEKRSMSRQGFREEKDQVSRESTQEDLNKSQTSKAPQVSWGLEGRCVTLMIPGIELNEEHIQNRDQQNTEETDQQSIGGNKTAGALNQYDSNTANTIIKEPSDVFIAIQACNSSLLSLTNQMHDLKKGYHGSKTRESKDL